MRFFQTDPQIIWTRILCPYCKKPTGHNTNCEDEGKTGFVKINDSISLPIFAENCFFKNERLWKADINYPFSSPLLEKILNQNINGLEKITPLKSHSFQISIARLNDDKTIKETITRIFKSFIKEMQSKELGLNEKIQPSDIIGVKFPNGNSYTYDPQKLTPEEIISQESYILDIISHYPGSELIIKSKGD